MLAVLLGASWVTAQDAENPAAGTDGQVWVADLEGPLGPAAADFIMRSMADAEAAGARAFIIRMDTPGGLDSAMREIIKAILASSVPVVTYVSPPGSRAASR